MKNRIFTVPNQLTFLRLAFLPFFIIAIKYDRYALALGILVAGGLSDGLDGWLARGLNQKNGPWRVSRSHRGQAAAVVVLFRPGAQGQDWLVAGDYGSRPRRPIAGGLRGDSADGRLPAVSAEHLGKSDDVLRNFADRAGSGAGGVGQAGPWLVREICGYCVAALVIISGLHYSIVVSRQLHAGQ